MDLKRVDLNLLVAFEALMEGRSVTGAAARLGVSQPAMSSTLQRLRTLFGDQLFVRSGRGMLPTARAEALAAPIAEALARLRVALEPVGPFNARSSTRVFHVSGGDYAAMVILPRLAANVAEEAPSVDLRFRFVEKDQVYGLLDTGEIDLALRVFPEAPKRLAMQALFEERFVCVADRNNPGLAGGMTLAVFAALPHLLVTERGDAVGAVDEALGRQGLRRRIALTIPHVLVVPTVLPGSPMIATVGARVARGFSEPGHLVMHEPPVAMAAWR